MSFSVLSFVRPGACAGAYRKPHGAVLRRLALLCSVSIIAFADAGVAGQLPASAFQTYDASVASAIVAGPNALYTVRVNDILPTQMNLGFAEVGKKVTAYDLLKPSGLASDLITSIEPVVIGPGGKLYLTNGHHTFTSLQQSIYGGLNPTVYVNVIANYSGLTEAQFWTQMQASNYLLPLDNGVIKSLDPLTGSPIPSAFSSMTNDPYRGLEYGILKNKNSKLFPTTSNITGAVGSAIPGLDKTSAYYSDFIWANAYRYANNGLGLPYLSPGDILIATKWNLTGASITKLQEGGPDVTVAQLPGYILPGSLVISSVIDTNTVTNGVLDGYGTFTGLRGMNLGTVTIGTPASTTGFILQLGADLGGTVALSGANTYAGGTTILAGTLIISNDANLGAASPSSPVISAIRTADDVRAANGIVFNSLSEGKGTLQINSSMSLNRPIGVGGETAIINPNGNTVTLTGPVVSLDINSTGFSDLTVAKSGGGTVILAPTAGSNPYFYGNWIISGGTFQASSDAALGNTTGPSHTIGQIILDGGTFKAGASFNSVRSLSLTGGSTYDTNGFTTSFAGSLTDVQRRLTVTNSSTVNDGAVTFGSLNISGANTTNATGATSTLRFTVTNGSTKKNTVTLTDGVIRTDRSTLMIQPSSTTSLGVTEFVFSGTAPTLTNTLAPVWMISNTSSATAYDFLTYGANGYVKATYSRVGSGASGGINDALTTSSSVVEQSGNGTITANRSAYALKLDNSTTITINAGQTLTLGDGVHAAGLIMSGSGSNGSKILGTSGTLAFGGSEAVIFSRGTATDANRNEISATITGTNGLTFAGEGMLTLSNVSAGLTGPVNIDSGTLIITAANALTNVSSLYLSNVSSNPAAAGLTVTANNAFASLNSAGSNSSITVSGANTVLTIGQTGNANSALNNLDSTISSTITATGVAAGSAAIVKAGTGMLDLSGATLTLTSGSNIEVNAGTLRVSASSFTNTNNIATLAGSEVQFAQNAGGKFAGNITGGGAMHLIGGTLQLTGTGNNYTGGTFVEQGSTLDLTTANVSTGNADIVNAGGLIVFDQTTSGTYGGVISDGCQMMQTCTTKLSGSLVKDDSTGGNSGNVTLGAVQTYTGGTFVEAGTLTLGVANAVTASKGVDLGRVGGGATATLALGADNTIQGLMSEKSNTTMVQLNARTLTVNTASNLAWVFDGSVTGTGGFVKTGGGTQILGGTSTYSGATTVDAGLLSVNGSIASSSLTTVNAGGTLGGSGTVGNTNINGGTLLRSDTTGALTVQGSLAFTGAATYLVEVSPASAGLTNVTGAASLAGTVNAYFKPGTYIERQYTILTAATGFNGTSFNALANTNLPGGFSSSLSYGADSVLLNLAFTLAQTAGLNDNQRSVANTLTNYFNANGIPAMFGALSPRGLTQVAGETATGVQTTTYNAMTQFMGVMSDPFVEGRGSATFPGQPAMPYADADEAAAFAYAATGRKRTGSERDAYAAITKAVPRAADVFAQRWSVWGAGYGGSQTTDGNAAVGSNTATSRIYGMAVGADYRFSPDTLAGFALAGGGTNFSAANSGTGRSDLFQAGVFVRHSIGAAYVSAALAYGWQDVTTDRTVTVAGSDQLRANFKANAFSGRVESGYRFVVPQTGMGVTPYVAGQFTTFYLPSYAEQAITGTNTFALSYASKDATDSRSELGLRGDKSFVMQDAILTLRGRAAWAHDYNADRSVAATFQTLPGASFVVNGAAPARDAALLTAAAEVKWLNGFSLAGTFESEISNTTRSYSGRGMIRYAW